MLAGVLLLPLVIVWFGAGPYGVWLLLSGLAMFLFQADLGIGVAVVRLTALARSHEGTNRWSEVLSTAVAWSAGIGVLAAIVLVPLSLFLLATSGSSEVLPRSDLAFLTAIAAGMLVFTAFRPFGSLMQGAGYWMQERSTQILGVLVRIVGTVIVGLTTQSIIALALVEALAAVLPALVAVGFVYARTSARFRPGSISRRSLREQLGYSGRAFAVNAVGSSILQSGIFLVGIFVGAAAVTYWNAIFRVFSVYRQALQWIVDPFMPRLSLLYSRDSRTAHRVFLGLTTVVSACAMATAPAAILLTPTVLTAWLGNDAPVSTMILPLQVLFASAVLNVMHLPALTALNAFGRPGIFLPLHVTWLVATLGLGAVLLPPLGLVGMAIALAVPLVVLEPLYLLAAARALGVGLADLWMAAAIRPALALTAALVPTILIAFVSGTNQLAIVMIGTLSAVIGVCTLLYFLSGKGNPDARFSLSQRA